jgi:hypothetical protein
MKSWLQTSEHMGMVLCVIVASQQEIQIIKKLLLSI